MKINVYDKNKKAQGELEFSKIFETEINESLIHQAVTARLAGMRSGNASTKTRKEISGSTRKLFKQKGSGRARQGDIKAPNLAGGGTAFGPKPRSYEQKFNKKMQKAALIQAFAAKIKDNKVIVLNDLNFEAAKTKNISTLLKTFESNCCLFVDNTNDKLILSSRNIYKVKTLKPEQLNTYDVIRYDHIIITKSALEKLSSNLA